MGPDQRTSFQQSQSGNHVATLWLRKVILHGIGLCVPFKVFMAATQLDALYSLHKYVCRPSVINLDTSFGIQ